VNDSLHELGELGDDIDAAQTETRMGIMYANERKETVQNSTPGEIVRFFIGERQMNERL
jgi:hypothetical protein